MMLVLVVTLLLPCYCYKARDDYFDDLSDLFVKIESKLLLVLPFHE